jgi:Carboxypeptidase regulatory-like domain/Putative zinc-finger
MSEILQAGQHPDADQLNAFVEHTLPAHEQQQTLAHLAICPACRQMVALSLPPADESPVFDPAVRHRWFPRWHSAWAGIPAFAALILVILFVRNGERRDRQASVPAQVADARKPAAPLVENTPPEVARDVARSEAPHAQRAQRKQGIAAATQPAPPAEVRQSPASGSAGGVVGGILGGVLEGAAPRPTQPATPGSWFGASAASAGRPVNGRGLYRVQSVLSAPNPLPSRLAILSMASNGNQRLAIDTDHHLFFSDDEGRNWKAVLPPWKGRAVAVALTSGVSSGNEAPALKMSFRPAAATDATLSGTITDPAGAVVPGATVVATNSAAEIVRSAATDNRGQYRMEGLVPGSYRIEAQSKGFETESFSAKVAPAQQAVADVTLRVGVASQTVAVEASPVSTEDLAAGASQVAKSPDTQTLSRFELTTDDGEHWMSTDGQSWTRE